MRTIRTKNDLREGVSALTRACAHMARVHALAGDPPLRRRPAGFKGLSRVVVGQQLSVSSAAAIWGRLEALAQPFTPASFLTLSDAALRRAGLSAAKIATLRGVAASIEAGALDLDGLANATDDEVHATLTAMKGIGPWTADIYMLFCLARADAWSPGDLALQVAVRDALALEARPDQVLMTEVAEIWRPWRSVAARMLWSFYAVRRKPTEMPV